MAQTIEVGEQKSKVFLLGIYPRCPFYKPVPVLIILVLIAFGTWGVYYLNVLAAGVYLIFSLVWYFVIMPFTLCKYCYYRATENAVDKDSGVKVKQLMSIEKWREMNGIEQHVGQARWTYCMSVIWLVPIPLIVISFFINFSIFALVALIGFIAVLVGNYYYMLRVKCPTCALRDDCHAAFSNPRSR